MPSGTCLSKKECEPESGTRVCLFVKTRKLGKLLTSAATSQAFHWKTTAKPCNFCTTGRHQLSIIRALSRPQGIVLTHICAQPMPQLFQQAPVLSLLCFVLQASVLKPVQCGRRSRGAATVPARRYDRPAPS